MTSVLLLVNVCVAVALIVIILLQKSDPASGGMFGGTSGGGGAVIRNPLAKPTAYLAAAFMILSLTLAVLYKGGQQVESVMLENTGPQPADLMTGSQGATLPALPELPAAPAPQEQ